MTTGPPHDRWAGLHDDLLICVFQLLAVHGRICFRAVCRSWRAAADVVQDPGRLVRMPPPWVVIPDNIGCSKSFTLISIPTQHVFRWTPPGGAGLRCVGSNGGWLAGAYIGADHTLRISLVNPLTETRVEMPAVGRVSSMPPAHHDSEVVERVLSTAVQKVAFSPKPTEQSFAVAVVGVTRSRVPASFGIAFARAGSEGWCAYAKIEDCDERGGGGSFVPRLDVAYHDGKFYYITATYERHLWVVDMAVPSPSPVQIAKFWSTTPRFYGVFSRLCTHHLAFSGDGALHMVSSEATDHGALHMRLQRYDPSPRSPWTPATRLRNQCFLVGDFNQTLCVTTDGCGDRAWLKPDSVYFTSIPICSLLAEHDVRGSGRDGVWLFNLDTGHIERPENFQRVRFRRPLEFLRPAWSMDLIEKETWDSFRSGLDWSKAIWFMPSRQ